jgi:hypothetical protein
MEVVIPQCANLFKQKEGKMQEAIALTREKEIRLLEQAVMRAESEGLQVLLRDPESRALTCALCGAESDHPSMIRHQPGCSYAPKKHT